MIQEIRDYAPKIDRRRQWHYRRRLGPIAYWLIALSIAWALIGWMVF